MEWVTGNVGAFLLTTRACAVKIEKEPHLLLIRRISVIDPPRADGGQHFEICTVRFIDRPDRAAMMHLSWCRTQKVSDQFTESVMQDGFTQTLNEIMRRITGANVVGDKRL
jgi:hypothetical protein